MISILVMNKKDLIDAVALETELTKKEIDMVLTLVLEKIMVKVSEGERVRLVGFGSFYKSRKKLNLGFINSTSLSGIFNVKFSPGKFFKQRVNVQD
jgi:DNA-binding protein HU-beta